LSGSCCIRDFDFDRSHLRRISHDGGERVQSEDAAQIRCSEELLEYCGAVDCDGAGAKRGSALIEEREGDLRWGTRVVEP